MEGGEWEVEKVKWGFSLGFIKFFVGREKIIGFLIIIFIIFLEEK